MRERQISEETRIKLGSGRIGKPPWNKGKKGVQVPWNKGIPQSEAAKEKNRLAHIGKTSHNYGKPAWNKGLKNTYRHTEEWKRKSSLRQMGEGNHRYGKPAHNRGKRVSKTTLKKMKANRANQVFPYKDTSIEIVIQNELNKLGIDFEKHKTFRIKNGYHQVDIFVPLKNLVIEINGCFWHGCQTCYPNMIDYKLPQFDNIIRDDNVRNSLSEKGNFIELWEHNIIDNLNGWVDLIKSIM